MINYEINYKNENYYFSCDFVPWVTASSRLFKNVIKWRKT